MKRNGALKGENGVRVRVSEKSEKDWNGCSMNSWIGGSNEEGRGV